MLPGSLSIKLLYIKFRTATIIFIFIFFAPFLTLTQKRILQKRIALHKNRYSGEPKINTIISVLRKVTLLVHFNLFLLSETDVKTVQERWFQFNYINQEMLWHQLSYLICVSNKVPRFYHLRAGVFNSIFTIRPS